MKENRKEVAPWRSQLHSIIFGAETRTGRIFDIILMISIILSVIAVMLDSVSSIREDHGVLLYQIEWFFTILFTIEYLLRLISARSAFGYAKSFFGVIDLMAIIPTFISIIFPGTQYFLVIRILRVLRIFRVLKFVQYIGEGKLLLQALKSSRRKITIFLFTVLTVVIVIGSLMYLIEGEENGFTSIPRSIYWAIVTITTVGYGDISPNTNLGQTLAAVLMIVGYGIIAVPTGIVTAEMTQQAFAHSNTKICTECNKSIHEKDAKHCNLCGAELKGVV